MGRGKVQLRRIDNTTIRNVTFCKRRCGLFKKARELATLCDADVALIVFSSSGIPFHYASPRGMKEIVQRYLRRQLDSASTVQSHIQDREILHLQRQLDDLQQQQRRLNSNTDGLKHLSIEELTRLEQTVSHALRNIRSKKDDMSSERISHLLRTERDLESKNDAMKKQVLDQLQAERGVLAMCPPLYDQPLTSQELRRISINRYSSACVDHSATQDEPMLQLRWAKPASFLHQSRVCRSHQQIIICEPYIKYVCTEQRSGVPNCPCARVQNSGHSSASLDGAGFKEL